MLDVLPNRRRAPTAVEITSHDGVLIVEDVISKADASFSAPSSVLCTPFINSLMISEKQSVVP
jgi:hypothetical protein